MDNFTYSFYIGILPSLGIGSIAGWFFFSSFLLIITGFMTSVGEVISIKKDNLLFSVILSSSLMLVYLGVLGVFGFSILPFIWLATHVLIVQVRKG